MNDVKNSKTACEFMAAIIVRVLLVCTTSVIVKLITAQDLISDPVHTEIGLQFQSEPKDIVAVHGKRAELNCSVSTTLKGKLFLHWTRNNVTIMNTRRRYVRENLSAMLLRSSLIFTKVIGKKKNNQTDVGVYHCVASITFDTNTAVLISRPVVIKIAEISAFSGQSESLNAVVNETVRLSCEINSTPAAEITWTFQNKSLHLEDKRYDTTIPGVLYISDLQLSDDGEYRCLGNNIVLNKTRRSPPIVLNIKHDTDFIPSSKTLLSPLLPKSITVLKSNKLNLECAAAGHHDVNILWMYRVSENATSVLISEKRKRYNILQIVVHDINDSGIYTCVISHRNFRTNYTQSVHVIVVTPPVIIEEPKSKKLALANSVRLPCKARGHPRPVISWLHNGNQLKPDVPRRTDSDDVTLIWEELVLTNIISVDFGIYQCIASNEYGVTWTAAHLYIDDTTNPLAPINLICRVVNSTAVWVYWEQPKKDKKHLQHPVHYWTHEDEDEDEDEDEVQSTVTVEQAFSVVYQSTDGGAETHVPTLNSSLLVSNLVPNTNYRFYVRTYGGRSGSDPSEVVTCFTSEEKKFLPSVSPDISKMITPMNESVLELRLINETTVEVNWKLFKPTTEFEVFIIKFKKRDDISSKTKYVDFDQKQAILFGLEPETVYEISLKLIVNGTEAEIVSNSILTTKPEKIRPPIFVHSVSSNSIELIWTHFSNIASYFYKIEYKKEGTDTWLNASPKVPGSNSVIISDLQPNTVYFIKVKSFNDSYLENSFPALEVRTRSTSLIVQGLFFKPLNSSAVRIYWKKLNNSADDEKSYLVSYLSDPNNKHDRNNVSVPGNISYLDINNLKPNVKYAVTVRVKNNVTTLGPESKALIFMLDPDPADKSQEFGQPFKIAGTSLSSEQMLGVFIGCGIAIFFIILCILTIICCKRRFEKYHHQAMNRPRIFSDNEKQEIKILSKTSSNYKIHYVNGRSNVNVHLPLLSSNSSFSNGCVQSTNVDNHCKFYDLESKAVRVENDKLLNFDSPLDDSCLTIHEMNEPDHEGGDSGYCDRHPSQSPQIKECSQIHRFRKCSDITMDDGFYENEPRATSGTSPT